MLNFDDIKLYFLLEILYIEIRHNAPKNVDIDEILGLTKNAAEKINKEETRELKEVRRGMMIYLNKSYELLTNCLLISSGDIFPISSDEAYLRKIKLILLGVSDIFFAVLVKCFKELILIIKELNAINKKNSIFSIFKLLLSIELINFGRFLKSQKSNIPELKVKIRKDIR